MNAQNPYQPPRSAVVEHELLSPQADPKAHTFPRSKVLLIAYWLVFIASFSLPIFAVFVVPVFESVFESFGKELPLLTKAVINYRLALLLWPFIALVPAVFISLERTHSQKSRSAYKAGFVVLLLALCGSVFAVFLAMYLPVFQLGQVA